VLVKVLVSCDFEFKLATLTAANWTTPLKIPVVSLKRLLQGEAYGVDRHECARHHLEPRIDHPGHVWDEGTADPTITPSKVAGLDR